LFPEHTTIPHQPSTTPTPNQIKLNHVHNPNPTQAIQWLESSGHGRRQVNYKLRDWLFARQRYWGEPFPILFPEGSDEPVAIPESDLPLTLPETRDFKPSGTPESPLANITEWVNTVDPATGEGQGDEGVGAMRGAGVGCGLTGRELGRGFCALIS